MVPISPEQLENSELIITTTVLTDNGQAIELPNLVVPPKVNEKKYIGLQYSRTDYRLLYRARVMKTILRIHHRLRITTIMTKLTAFFKTIVKMRE